LESLQRGEDVRVTLQDTFELGERLFLRAPMLRRVQGVGLRTNLHELEKIAVDDQFDVASLSLRSGRLSTQEIRKLALFVDEVVAGLAIPQVQVADDERYTLGIHVGALCPWSLHIERTLQRVPQTERIVGEQQLAPQVEQDLPDRPMSAVFVEESASK